MTKKDMKIKTYDQAIKYMETFIKPVVFEKISQKEARLKNPLDRMRKLLGLLGNPQNRFKSVLVGGTSGKGSTSYFISHIFKGAGYKSGLTISPHLQKVNERIQMNGVQISDEDFVKLLNKVVPAIEKMRKGKILNSPKGISTTRVLPSSKGRHFMAARVQDDKGKVQDDNHGKSGEPSYFEILVAMAFLYFAKQEVDIAVVEVGMGGVYDATNTLSPLISVITNVSLDHTDILGKTVEKIAKEKVGIIKKNQRSKIKDQKFLVVTGVRQRSIIKIVEDKCKEVGAKLYRLGKDFNYEIKKESTEGTEFDLTINCGRSKKLNNLRLSAIGGYQVENASLAVKTVLELQKFGFKISKQNIRKALSTSFFPGRFEIISKNSQLSTFNFQLILDGAHNPAKMKAFISSLEKVYPPPSPRLRSLTHQSFSDGARTRKIFIVAFKDDKDAKGMLKEILKVADVIIITEFHRIIEVKGHGGMKRSNFKFLISNFLARRDPALQDKYKENIKIYYAQNSKEALEKALNILQISHSEFISESQDGLKEIPKQVRDDIYDNENSLIVVTGSLYLVGEIRNLIIQR